MIHAKTTFGIAAMNGRACTSRATGMTILGTP
jgi:hypothetical protein